MFAQAPGRAGELPTAPAWRPVSRQGPAGHGGRRPLSRYAAAQELGAAGGYELVRRWKAAGLVIAGKTNTSEFGFMPWTELNFSARRTTPTTSTRTAGGSSGGSGAAVARAWCPLASGGDGGDRFARAGVGQRRSVCRRAGRTPAGPLYSFELWEGAPSSTLDSFRARQRSAARRHRRRRHRRALCRTTQERPFLPRLAATPASCASPSRRRRSSASTIRRLILSARPARDGEIARIARP